MDDFKLNAKKIIAAQKAKDRRAQSPETESNWDSSEPEDDDTVTQISSGEEFSVGSTRSQKSAKSINKATKQVRAENLKNKTPSKPETASSNRKTSKTSVDSASAAKSAVRSGVNVFVDRGMYDSEEDSQRSTTRKAKKKKNADENPPYDFRNAINDDDPPSERSNQRPGRSRKGQSYDPAPPKSKPQAPPQIDTGSWDDSDENEKALAEMLRERDGVVQSNNNKAPEETETKPSHDNRVAEEKKKKGWSVSLKRKPKETKEKKKREEEKREEKKMATAEVTNQEMPVVMATPPHPALRHTEVAVEEFPAEEIQSIVSLETDSKARYVYVYHHGNTSYSDTRQVQEEVYMTSIADKSERVIRRCAREIFATLRILVDFFLIFLLEGLRFFLFNIIGALLVGLTLGFGNYFLRPLAAALFNGLCQPIAMFFFNVGVATRTATQPFIEVLHKMLSVVAMVIRAFRLVEISRNSERQPHIQEV